MATKMTRNRLMTFAALATLAPAVVLADGALKPKVLMVMMDGVRGDVVENAPMPNLLALREGRWRPGYKGFSTLTAHTLYDARPSSAANHCAIATGTFDIDYGEWCFYAVTRRADGVLTIYQGGQDGHLYWIAEDASALVLKTGLPFWIGQDGTGKCKVSLKGDVDDFALWTRALTREEVRRIHDAGRKGHDLGSMLNFPDKISTCK